MFFKMNRLWTALFLLGCLFIFSAVAEDTGNTPAPSGGGQDSSASGGAGGTGGGQGAAEGGAPAPAVSAPAAPVVLPGAYGSAPITLTPGAGRFSKPPYSFTLTLQQGYDDNVFTTASNRVGSLVTNSVVGFSMQSANPRTIFTLDSNAGISYFWYRPGARPEDYNGSLNLLFFHRFTPRMSLSVTANVAYLSQANFSAINATVNQQGGDYILGSSRFNLTYQWLAKLQTNTSYSYDTTLYQKKTSQGSDIYDNTFGNEIRFLINPRTSLVTEWRYMLTSYPNLPTGDSTTLYGLLGADYTFSSRLLATLRGGLQYRDYTNTTGSSSANTATKVTQSSPYGEMTLTYVYGHQSTMSWTNRFGLDSSNIASQKVTSFRTGLNFSHVLTAKLTLNFGLNYNITDTSIGPQTVLRQVVVPGNIFYIPNQIPCTSTFQNQYNSVLGFVYRISPKLSLNASYTFTDVLSATKAASYFRNQVFLGGTYTF